jgi:putative transposase
MSPFRPPRVPAFSYLGPHRYFLTICTAKRRKSLAEPETARFVIAHLLQHADSNEFDVLAYCVMPDHLHALVHGRSDAADLCRFVHRFKLATGFAWRRRSPMPLWQEGYYDHVLRHEEATEVVIRYIVANPVRAGLVEDINNYPWIGSAIGSLPVLLDICLDWRPPWRLDRGSP